MNLKLLFVLALLAVCVAHLGEPQSCLLTVFDLVERLIGVEQEVKGNDVKINSLTGAVAANTENVNDIDDKLTNNVQLLKDEVSLSLKKIDSLELELSNSLNKIGALEMSLTKATQESAITATSKTGILNL